MRFVQGTRVEMREELEFGAGLYLGQSSNGTPYVDVAVDGGGTATGHNHNDMYYTEAESNARYRALSVSVPWTDLDSGTIPSTFTPSAHAASHSTGGGDAIDLANLAGTLARAQQASGTAYLDLAQTFTAGQTFTGGVDFKQTVLTRIYPPTDGGAVQFRFGDKADASNTTGYFQSANSNSAGNRYIGIQAQSDRDGNRMHIRMAVLDAAGSIVNVLEVPGGTDAGKMSVFGAAVAGSEVSRILSDNRSSTANTGAGIAFRTGTSGVTTVAELMGIYRGTVDGGTAGDLSIRVRKSGTVAEALAITNQGNFGFGGTSYGGGKGVSFHANASVNPTTNPTGGYIQYGLSGVPAFRTSAGAVIDLTPRTITGSRASGAALVSALTQMAATGLFIDNTTA